MARLQGDGAYRVGALLALWTHGNVPDKRSMSEQLWSACMNLLVNPPLLNAAR